MTALTIEQRREASRRGGLARAAQFTRESQQHARAHVKPASLAAAGHRGAIEFMRRHGYAKLYHLCRAWRLQHPSSHEQQVMAMLGRLGLTLDQDYFREYEAEPFRSIDIALPALMLAIEINGKPHYDPLFDDPRYPGTRAANDELKLARLRALGYRVLVLDYRELDRAEYALREFVLGA